MSGELNLHTDSGEIIKVIVWGEDRTTRWNGSAMVSPSTISDVAWGTGMVTCAEEITSDATGTGTYVGDFPVGITDGGEYAIEFYLGVAPTPGQLMIGVQTVQWDGSSVVSLSEVNVDVYHADVQVLLDADNNQDEYTVHWFKTDDPVLSGITNATLQVTKRSDGSDLIAVSSMTLVAAAGVYKYNATAVAGERLTAGEAAIAIVSADIDGATRTWREAVGRDEA